MGSLVVRTYGRSLQPHAPQFNRENLKQSLREHGIAYVFLGQELGARSEDRRVTSMGRFSMIAWPVNLVSERFLIVYATG